MKNNRVDITIVAGARPNFIKIAPIMKAIDLKIKNGINLSYQLVHTGQHYDDLMSRSFFEDLGIPVPDINLEVGEGSAIKQMADIMVRFENYLIDNPTSLVIVVGDVTSTISCALVTQKLGIKLAHVEAGIRSFDKSMPEEANRKVTDSLADYFFTTSLSANNNLLKEGISTDNIFFVGNVMIDTLLNNLHKAKKPDFYDVSIAESEYLILTLHRPNNVDNPVKLIEILSEIDNSSNNLPVVFPVHPRTQKILETKHYSFNHIIMVPPLRYLEFLYLMKSAKAVVTDSGGITEETTVLGIPCLTLRDNTEREETCTIGTNELIGSSPQNIKANLIKVFEGNWKKGGIPSLWDGKASDRIIDLIIKMLF